MRTDFGALTRLARRQKRNPEFEQVWNVLRTQQKVWTTVVRVGLYALANHSIGTRLQEGQCILSLSSPKGFRPLPGNSLITCRSPWPRIRYKILITVLSSSVKIISVVFKRLLGLQENRRLIITNNIENWFSKLVKEVAINWFYSKMQLPHAASQDSSEFIFQQVPYGIGYASSETLVL